VYGYIERKEKEKDSRYIQESYVLCALLVISYPDCENKFCGRASLQAMLEIWARENSTGAIPLVQLMVSFIFVIILLRYGENRVH
jgi:hypothetical protein